MGAGLVVDERVEDEARTLGLHVVVVVCCCCFLLFRVLFCLFLFFWGGVGWGGVRSDSE